MNIQVQVIAETYMYFHFFMLYSRHVFNFLTKFELFFKVIVLFYIPTSITCDFQLFHILTKTLGIISLLNLFIYFQREGKAGRKREKNIDWLPLAPAPTGAGPEIQTCALTGNQTSNTLLCEMTPTPLSLTGQDFISFSNLSHSVGMQCYFIIVSISFPK